MQRHKITSFWFTQFEDDGKKPKEKNSQVTEAIRQTIIKTNLKSY